MHIQPEDQSSPPVFSKQEEELFFYESSSDENSWAIPWSDLMMTMFILFALLFIFVSAKSDVFHGKLLEFNSFKNQKNGMENAKSFKEVRMQIERQEEEVLVEDKTNSRRVLIPPEEQARITKESAVFFRKATAKLEQTAQDLLRELAEELRKNKLQIHLIGNGDEDFEPGTNYKTNLELSLARAIMVARFLIEECGIEKKRVLVSGQPSTVPLVPGKSRTSKMHNRRVEIFFLAEKK